MAGRPGIETGELRTEDIGTEVFFMPVAAHTEKDGSFTNTQRLLQFHHQAVEPPGEARSDLWFTYHLGRRIREKLADPTVRAEETVIPQRERLQRRSGQRPRLAGPEPRGGLNQVAEDV